MQSTLLWLQQWMTTHPTWAGMIIFSVALIESLAIVGVFIPGASLLFAAGAMVGAGLLDFWSSMLWATLGAIIGDNLSYWLGHHYRERLHQWWPFYRYPKMLQQGQVFFKKHGNKSVALGRFVGPIRAVIPAIAGLMQMPPWRFFSINVLSALAWAPTYLLPGVIVGASLKLAAEVAGRLVVFMVLTIMIIWLSYALVKRLYRVIEPRVETLLAQLLKWSGRNRFLRLLAAAIVDPDQPETKGLFSWAVILLTASWIGYLLISSQGEHVSVLDLNTYQGLQQFRTPWIDWLMAALSTLGSTATLLPSALAIALVLLWERFWKTALHWLTAIAFSALTTWLLVGLTPGATQTATNPQAWLQSIPQIDIATSVAYFGFLSVIAAQRLGAHLRVITYAIAVVACILILLAKLYLGISQLSSGLGALFLALAWISVLGLAYRRHYSAGISLGKLIAAASVSFAGMAIVTLDNNIEQTLAMVNPQPTIVRLSEDIWWQTDWQTLPILREDAFGRQHPFNLQWTGDLPTISARLESLGWKQPAQPTLANALLFISPKIAFERLPVLPHVYRGKHENLVLTRSANRQNEQWVIRLWQTRKLLTRHGAGHPLYIGNISKLVLHRPLGIFSAPRTDVFDGALNLLQSSLSRFSWRRQRRVSTHIIKGTETLLLIRNPVEVGE